MKFIFSFFPSVSVKAQEFFETNKKITEIIFGIGNGTDYFSDARKLDIFNSFFFAKRSEEAEVIR